MSSNNRGYKSILINTIKPLMLITFFKQNSNNFLKNQIYHFNMKFPEYYKQEYLQLTIKKILKNGNQYPLKLK